PISQFGLLEMTRQRMRASLRKTIHQECTSCNGRGFSMSPESVILSVMRRLALVMNRDDVERIELTISPDVAFHILNRKRGELVNLEKKYGKTVMVRVGGNTIDFVNISVLNAAGVTLPSDAEALMKHIKPTGDDSFRELVHADLPEDLELEEAEDDEAQSEEENIDPSEFVSGDAASEEDQASGKPRRRGRRRRKSSAKAGADADTSTDTKSPEDAEPRPGDDRPDDRELDEDGQPKRRRRRRRGGRGRKRNDEAQEENPARDQVADSDDESGNPGKELDPDQNPAETASAPSDDTATDDGADEPKKKSRRRRRGRKKSGSPEAREDQASPDATEEDTSAVSAAVEAAGPEADAEGHGEDKPKRRRRRSGRKKKSADNGEHLAAAKSTKKKKTRPRAQLPLDENGDVNGNVKLPEAAAPDLEPRVDDNAPVAVVKKKSMKKKPPAKPGRGYANRIISTD
ncbi:MAG: hypothetical protein AAGL98_08780, partial [Planctomycetota bacterium]